MDCKMEAKGVTPIPVPTKTACCARKMCVDGAPKGPSMKIWKIYATGSKSTLNNRFSYLQRLANWEIHSFDNFPFFRGAWFVGRTFFLLSFLWNINPKLVYHWNSIESSNHTDFHLLSCRFERFKRRSLERDDCWLISHVSEALSDSAVLGAVVSILKVLQQRKIYSSAVERLCWLRPKVVTQTTKNVC